MDSSLSVVVAKKDGKLVGLVSSGDLTRWVVDEQKAEINDLSQNAKSLASAQEVERGLQLHPLVVTKR